MGTKLREHLGIGAVALLIAAIFTAICIIPAMAEMSSLSDGWHEKGIGRHKRQRSPLSIWRNPHLVQELELSEDQIDHLRDADFTIREKKLKMKAELDGLKLQMDKAFSDDIVDEKTVRQLAAKIADIKGRLFTQNVESRLTARKILSVDQLDKLRLLKKHKRRAGAHKGRKPVSVRPSVNQAGAPELT